MRIYLDNCCFNRPFDDQSQLRIWLETEAKLFIQSMVRDGKLQLAWSHILDYENEANPFEERRRAIETWKPLATCDVAESPEILLKAAALSLVGIKPKDALHVSCAINAACDYFLTTDDTLISKGLGIPEVKVRDPPTFVREMNL